MKAIDILIHNYKSICSDVSECKLKLDDKVTILIGANESGKTNILEAIQKFSQGGFEETDVPQMSQHSGKTEIPGDLPMVSITYSVEDSDQPAFEKMSASLVGVKAITITRNFSGDPYISATDREPESDVRELLAELHKRINDFAPGFRTYIKQYRQTRKGEASPTRSAQARLKSLLQQVKVLSDSFDQSQIAAMRRKVKRLTAAVQELSSPLDSLETKVLQPLELIAEIVEELPKGLAVLNISQKLQKLWQVVPRFEVLPGEPSVWLSGEYLVEDIINQPETEAKLASVRRLLSLGGLDLQNTIRMREEVQPTILERASEKATKALQQVWKKGGEEAIEIIFRWSPSEGNRKLLIMVSSRGHRGYPQYRSYGFRWFLEFYLLHGAKLRSGRPAVLVFEEPGIHLHPYAQGDLMRLIFDTVAADSQVIYTTHLPGMYNLAHPESARAVMKSPPETPVTVIESEYSPEHSYTTWEVAMSCLGLSSPLQRMWDRNIIVEGPADWIWLLTFSQLLAPDIQQVTKVASGYVHIFPCTGTTSVRQQVPLFFQQGVLSTVVLDSDQPGESARSRLQTELGIPNEYVKRIVMINDVEGIKESLGSGQHEIEDLLGKKFYAELVNRTLGKKDKLAEEDFESSNLLGRQAVKLVKDRLGAELRKDQVAWKFRELFWSDKVEVPEDVKNYFKSLLLMAVRDLV